MMHNVIRIARRAGRVLLSFYKSPAEVRFKRDRSPVTRADTEANQVILKGLKEIDAGIPVISEESRLPPPRRRRRWKEFWLVDPLDGTKEFLSRTDEYTVNIALVRGGVPVLGVIYAPSLGLLYYAEEGKGAWKIRGSGRPRRIYSRKPKRREALVVLESRFHASPCPRRTGRGRKRRILTVGSSLKFCRLAEGTAHVYPRNGPTMEWDVAAGDCIFRNARRRGRNFSPLKYNKPDLKNGPFVLAA